MPKCEGEVRDIPFLGNDLKDQLPTTGRPLDRMDAPGKADSEWIKETEPEKLEGNIAVNIDDAQLD